MKFSNPETSTRKPDQHPRSDNNKFELRPCERERASESAVTKKVLTPTEMDWKDGIRRRIGG